MGEVQRAAKRYDDGGHGKYIWLRPLLLAAVIITANALPSQTNIRPMTNILLECRYIPVSYTHLTLPTKA